MHTKVQIEAALEAMAKKVNVALVNFDALSIDALESILKEIARLADTPKIGP